jgi:hypothetical protein
MLSLIKAFQSMKNSVIPTQGKQVFGHTCSTTAERSALQDDDGRYQKKLIFMNIINCLQDGWVLCTRENGAFLNESMW